MLLSLATGHGQDPIQDTRPLLATSTCLNSHGRGDPLDDISDAHHVIADQPGKVNDKAGPFGAFPAIRLRGISCHGLANPMPLT